jgi:hypothetical protein
LASGNRRGDNGDNEWVIWILIIIDYRVPGPQLTILSLSLNLSHLYP